MKPRVQFQRFTNLPSHCLVRKGAEVHHDGEDTYVKFEDIICWYWEPEESEEV